MGPHDHSRILYLLDALRVAPAKAVRLLEMAERAGGPDRYLGLVWRLRASLGRDLLDEVARVRREIR